MGNTFNVIITGRKAAYLAVDPKTQKHVVAIDDTPQRMQYLDARHAFMDAPKLAGLSAANPNAVVEVRPADLPDAMAGAKLPLTEWIEGCANSPLPAPASSRPVKKQFISQIDQVLAEQEPSPAVAPVPAAPVKAPEPVKVDAVADVAAAAAK